MANNQIDAALIAAEVARDTSDSVSAYVSAPAEYDAEAARACALAAAAYLDAAKSYETAAAHYRARLEERNDPAV